VAQEFAHHNVGTEWSVDQYECTEYIRKYSIARKEDVKFSFVDVNAVEYHRPIHSCLFVWIGEQYEMVAEIVPEHCMSIGEHTDTS